MSVNVFPSTLGALLTRKLQDFTRSNYPGGGQCLNFSFIWKDLLSKNWQNWPPFTTAEPSLPRCLVYQKISLGSPQWFRRLLRSSGTLWGHTYCSLNCAQILVCFKNFLKSSKASWEHHCRGGGVVGTLHFRTGSLASVWDFRQHSSAAALGLK